MSKMFYIYLSEDSEDQSIGKLVLHAIEAIKEYSIGKQVSLTHFDLVRPESKFDRYSIFYEFQFINKKEKKQIEQIKEARMDNCHECINVGTVGISESLSNNSLVSWFELRLYGKNQDEDLVLAGELAKRINKLVDARILDFVYHDYTDVDGLRHPYISVYYMPAKQS